MAEAETSDARLAYSRESTYGVNPGSGAKYLRMTSESLQRRQGNTKSEEITGDRNPRQNIRTTIDAGGDFSFEFSANNFDDLLEDACMADFPAMPSVIEASIEVDGDAQKFTAASGLGGLVKGQWIRTFGFTNPENNGLFQLAANSSETEIQVLAGSGIVDESSATRSIQPSAMLRPGSTLHSATYEKQFTDISKYEAFVGMVVESLSLSMSREQVITGSVSLVGKDSLAPTGSTGMGTISAAGTELVVAAVDALRGIREGSLIEDTDLRITELSMTLSNATRLKRGAADDTPFSVGLGILDVELSASFYFSDDSLIAKYRNNAVTPFSFRIDCPGMSYVFTLPQTRILDLGDPISGPSDDVYLNLTLSAETDSNGVAFQIDKLPTIS